MIDSIDYLLKEISSLDTKVLQANVSRSRSAQQQTLEYAQNNDIDLVAVSEPFFDLTTAEFPKAPQNKAPYGTNSTVDLLINDNASRKVKYELELNLLLKAQPDRIFHPVTKYYLTTNTKWLMKSTWQHSKTSTGINHC